MPLEEDEEQEEDDMRKQFHSATRGFLKAAKTGVKTWGVAKRFGDEEMDSEAVYGLSLRLAAAANGAEVAKHAELWHQYTKERKEPDNDAAVDKAVPSSAPQPPEGHPPPRRGRPLGSARPISSRWTASSQSARSAPSARSSMGAGPLGSERRDSLPPPPGTAPPPGAFAGLLPGTPLTNLAYWTRDAPPLWPVRGVVVLPRPRRPPDGGPRGAAAAEAAARRVCAGGTRGAADPRPSNGGLSRLMKGTATSTKRVALSQLLRADASAWLRFGDVLEVKRRGSDATGPSSARIPRRDASPTEAPPMARTPRKA